MKFTDFKFEPSIQEGLESIGFVDATPIQEQAIPFILDNKDLIACAQTGTGKTAAFLLPILNKLVQGTTDHIDTLIVVPTRELALQIDQVLQGFSYYTNISSISIYGGSDGSVFEIEKRALEEKTNIIIATPGRLISHLSLGYVNFSQVKHFILDEADRMLDMGFMDDIMKISSYLPKVKQTLMFSATMPDKIRDLTKKLLNNPKQISISMSKPAEGVLQAAYLVENHFKNELLLTLLEGKEKLTVLIFCSTRSKVKELAKELKHYKLKVKAIHSDLEQSEREEVLRNFRNKSFNILVATDVLSRGIDIEDIGLIINYDVPHDAEDYVHRVGRTARAEATGVALTLICKKEQGTFYRIEQLIGYPVHKLPLPPQLGKSEEYKPLEERKNRGNFRSGKNENFRGNPKKMENYKQRKREK